MDGVAQDWFVMSMAQSSLQADEQVIAAIKITPPRHFSSQVGPHQLTIRVLLPDYPEQSAQHNAILEIKPYYKFATSGLLPKQLSVARFKHRAKTLISITNQSNCEATFRLTGHDYGQGCQFEFLPPNEKTSLALQVNIPLNPGHKVSVPIYITLPSRSLLGLGKVRYNFVITNMILAGSHTFHSLSGQVKVPSLLGPWVTALIICGVIILLGLVVRFSIITYLQDPHELSAADTITVFHPTPAVSYNIPVQSVRPISTQSPSPNQEPMTYKEMFQEIGPQYDLDWRLLAAVANKESRMDPVAMGKDYDMGLMQIIPTTWNEWAPQVGVSDPFDPYSNILVGTVYLAYVRDYAKTKGYEEPQWMLVGYNWGPDNLRKLAEDNGDWSQVPAPQRRYALEILQAIPEISE